MNLLILLVVLALAAATFVLSYSGVHAIVLQAGVSSGSARIYPWLFDAVFVIACVAAVTLRDARRWAQSYAWLVIILMVVVVGAADVVHAMNVTLPHRTIQGVVAAAPWALVLLGFTLMLTILWQPRTRPVATTALAGRTRPAESAYPVPGPAQLTEDTSEPDVRVLPVGVWVSDLAPEPEGVPAPEIAAAPDAETAHLGDATAEAGADAPEADTGTPVAAEADAGAKAEAGAAQHVDARHVDAAADSGLVATLEDEPAAAALPEEEPAQEHEPAAEPAAVAAHQEDATPTTPYSYWDSGVDSGFHEPDRVPTLPGGVPTVPGQVIDDDAPPFATAPFAAVPRLNRVRATPTPPEGDDDQV